MKQKMAETLIAVIGSLFGAGGFGAYFMAWFRERTRRKAQDRRQAGFRAIQGVYHALNVVKAETGADRAMILKTENNGGIPAAGCKIYSSVIYEVWNPPLSSVRDQWQRQNADEEYCRLIVQLEETGRAFFRTDQMPDSHIARLYRANGVSGSHVFRIGGNDREFVYLSVIFTGSWLPEPGADDRFENQVRSAVTEIQTRFRDTGSIF